MLCTASREAGTCVEDAGSPAIVDGIASLAGVDRVGCSSSVVAGKAPGYHSSQFSADLLLSVQANHVTQPFLHSPRAHSSAII